MAHATHHRTPAYARRGAVPSDASAYLHGRARHGHFLAADVGELAGVSGTTVGQWARRGYIRSSVSDGRSARLQRRGRRSRPAIVGELLGRGVSHADVRRAIARLREEYGDVAAERGAARHDAQTGRRTRVVLRERDGCYALSPRGWQLMTAPPPVEEVRLRLPAAAAYAAAAAGRVSRGGSAARRGRPAESSIASPALPTAIATWWPARPSGPGRPG